MSDSKRTQLILGGVLVAAAVVLYLVFASVGPDPVTPDAQSEGAADASVQQAAIAPSVNPKKVSAPTKIDAAPHELSNGDKSVLVKAAWGSGDGQLGRERREEGNAEGPMSLAVARNGDVLVLDQTNGRIARFDKDGKWKGSTPTPVQGPQELTQTPDGKTLVLDRVVDGQIAILDENGNPTAQLPVVGKSVAEGGAVTGMFVDGDSVYVEQEHGSLVRVGDTKGTVDSEQPEIPGRPTRDGKSYISAGIIEAATGRMYVNAIDKVAMAQRFTREYRLTPTLHQILLLDTDASGIIYLATNSDDGTNEQVTLLCLDPLDGRPIGTNVLPPNTLPEESFRDFAVLDQGGVVYSYRTEQGVELRRYDCR